jgi:hypothetical protein
MGLSFQLDARKKKRRAVSKKKEEEERELEKKAGIVFKFERSSFFVLKFQNVLPQNKKTDSCHLINP